MVCIGQAGQQLSSGTDPVVWFADGLGASDPLTCPAFPATLTGKPAGGHTNRPERRTVGLSGVGRMALSLAASRGV
jgi:hypothetical protein